jgi:hypothetical protein
MQKAQAHRAVDVHFDEGMKRAETALSCCEHPSFVKVNRTHARRPRSVFFWAMAVGPKRAVHTYLVRLISSSMSGAFPIPIISSA